MRREPYLEGSDMPSTLVLDRPLTLAAYAQADE